MHKGTRKAVLERLAEPPRKGNRKAADDGIERVVYLKAMNVDTLKLDGISLSIIRHYGEKMWHASFKYRQLDPLRTLRLICFLKWTLMESIDVAVLMCKRQVTRLWADKSKKAELLEAKEALSARDVLSDIFEMVDTLNSPISNFAAQLSS